jgi:polo-like kinase 1
MESTSIKTSIDKGKNNYIIDNCNLIYVVNWLDYSSKFSIGYELNNGTYGVFFNDSTKIILGQNGEEFCYFVKDNYNYYHINNYPKDNKDLNKKVILLNYFKKYFEEQNKNKKNNIKKSENKPYIYVKKWMRTKSAIIFRLNNKIIQFIFNDKTEIILVYPEDSVYFINHKGEKLKYCLKTSLDNSNK